MLSALALTGTPAQATALTPYASREPLRLAKPDLPETSPRGRTLDIDIDAAGNYGDPFDPHQVRLDAKVTEADGRTYSVPGYLDRPFQRSLQGDKEKVEPAGPPRWKLRLCPEKEGTVNVRITFSDGTGEKVQNASFQAVASEERGFIRTDPDDRRYFAFTKGGSYWPLGPNLAWAGPRGTYDYDDWLGKLGENGANYARLWLSPSWTTLAQELPGKAEEGKGVGRIDLANAWKLDRVLDTAREKGVYATLVLDSYGVLRQSGPNAWWDRTPHNSDNGGPLRIWRDFWSNETMERLYRNRLRYLVARYGANPHVFGWEFWNEVDRTSEYDPAVVRDWHQRMARALDGIDVYRHLRSTSLATTIGLRSIDLIPEFDLVQSHSGDAADPAGVVASQQSRKSGWGKPHLFGLVTADETDPRIEDDPEGMQVHDPIWASIATGASGGPAAWWWDRLLSDKGLFRLYDAPSRFLKGVDWTSERFRQTDVALSNLDPKLVASPADLVLDGGPARGPVAAVITGGVLRGPQPPGILHGTGLHPDLHNPVVLRIRVAKPTRFEINVSTVSGEGGANLRVALDDKAVLSRDFPDPDGDAKTETLRQYEGVLPITVPTGVHTLKIENTGTDWVRVDYRLIGVVPQKGPPLNAWAIVGDETVMAWVRRAGRTWRAAAEEHRTFAPSPPSIMRLRGLQSGTWRTEIWDTWTGKATPVIRAKVGIDGTVRIVLPRISRDVAVKLVHEGR